MKTELEKAREWWNSLSDTEKGYAALYFSSKNSKVKAYKILHKPTGLFYMPDSGRGNLSIKGKIYANYPILSRIQGITVKLYIFNPEKISKKDKILIDHFKIEKDFGKYTFDVNESEFEIIEI